MNDNMPERIACNENTNYLICTGPVPYFTQYIRRDLYEKLEQRINESEKDLDITVGQRDSAEQAISHAYYLIKGESPEWSNTFGYNDALEEVQDAAALLRESLAAATARIAELEKDKAAICAAIKSNVTIQLKKVSAGEYHTWGLAYAFLEMLDKAVSVAMKEEGK